MEDYLRKVETIFGIISGVRRLPRDVVKIITSFLKEEILTLEFFEKKMEITKMESITRPILG